MHEQPAQATKPKENVLCAQELGMQTRPLVLFPTDVLEHRRGLLQAGMLPAGMLDGCSQLQAMLLGSRTASCRHTAAKDADTSMTFESSHSACV